MATKKIMSVVLLSSLLGACIDETPPPPNNNNNEPAVADRYDISSYNAVSNGSSLEGTWVIIPEASAMGTFSQPVLLYTGVGDTSDPDSFIEATLVQTFTSNEGRLVCRINLADDAETADIIEYSASCGETFGGDILQFDPVANTLSAYDNMAMEVKGSYTVTGLNAMSGTVTSADPISAEPVDIPMELKRIGDVDMNIGSWSATIAGVDHSSTDPISVFTEGSITITTVVEAIGFSNSYTVDVASADNSDQTEKLYLGMTSVSDTSVGGVIEMGDGLGARAYYDRLAMGLGRMVSVNDGFYDNQYLFVHDFATNQPVDFADLPWPDDDSLTIDISTSTVSEFSAQMTGIVDGTADAMSASFSINL